MMEKAVFLLIPAALFAIMFALGLGLSWDSVQMVKDRPGLWIRLLLGTCLLVPLVALGLLNLPLSHALSGPTRFAIALMAICPSAPLSLRKAGKKGGNKNLAAPLQVSAAALAIVSIPLMAELFTQSFGLQGWEIGPKEVAGQIGQAQLLPLAVGLLVRHRFPDWSKRYEGFFDRLANGMLLLLIGAVLAKTGRLLIPFLVQNLLGVCVMGVMVIASLAIGHVLAGADPETRTTTALVTSMRNPGLALLLATTYAPGMGALKLAILSYLLMTVLLSIPYLQWRRLVRAQV